MVRLSAGRLLPAILKETDMIDFVKYVVSELRNKKLSKTDALSLIKQFSSRAANTAVLHPLLHSNTSDLGQQSYASVFTGEEFFLSDHRVNGQRLLPGVAYLEMARAAIAQASPLPDATTSMELRNVVWMQPVVVNGNKKVTVAVFACDQESHGGERLDYEICSEDEEQEIVHCQGQATFSCEPAPARLDITGLKEQMTRGRVEASVAYSAFSKMGIEFGPAFQAITTIFQGDQQLLAQLCLPAHVQTGHAEYGLHPSLMDAALQASIGFAEDITAPSLQARVPFALESLRIISDCTQEMYAWVRYSPASQSADKIFKLDIDLCDEHGNVCVQIRGFSSRVMTEEISSTRAREKMTASAELPAECEAQAEQMEPAVAVDAGSLRDKTQEYLRKQCSGLLKLASHKIDPQAALETYGIDSILAMKLTRRLEETFGPLSKTLFFEYQTIADLAEYFVQSHQACLATLFAEPRKDKVAAEPTIVLPEKLAPARPEKRSRKRFARQSHEVAPSTANSMGTDPIAIIGLSGRYPEAMNVEAYWDNLRLGKDCIVEVPKERWDWREYFSEDRSKSGHHYSKWGGFITGIDEFDPLFFNISPKEAKYIDPQERLFLQHAWMAMEDAGYTRAGLQVGSEQDLPGQVGVYVGVWCNEYQLRGGQGGVQEERRGYAVSIGSIANRVSYVLNVHGPSMTVDTMCSSSLTAIDLACQGLKQGRIHMAIAGGVNVSVHPNKYLMLSAVQAISSEGRCQSFGEGGDGYVPGEGVGVVVLKGLAEAERDGDHIYGVIRGSALNHGGKTNGYTVPNPQAQASVIRRALAEAKTAARHISYIEAHGTGTKLGDPIEIAALNQAYQGETEEKQYCALGSVKSNIGHCESAAGIAGLTKVLLQMQHGQLVPSLHAERLNPYIEFEKSAFVVNRELRAWERPVVEGREQPRIAGVSSFGAGGANAHVIVEEYVAGAWERGSRRDEVVIVLSARTEEQLKEKGRELVEYIEEEEAEGREIDVEAIGYTLQVGREAMEERFGMVVKSVAELKEKLTGYVAGKGKVEGAYRGQKTNNEEGMRLFSSDEDLQETVRKWMERGKYGKVLELWVRGVEVEWGRMYGERKPRRMSLPTYPFAREHYWIEGGVGKGKWNRGTGMGTGTGEVLHPLVHRNTSDLREQRYSTRLTGEEFFLADHEVAGKGSGKEKVLPAAAYLEMARAAMEQACGERGETEVLELRNVVWAEPVEVKEAREVRIALLSGEAGEIGFEIYSGTGNEEIVHCQGRGKWSSRDDVGKLDLEQLKQEMVEEDIEPEKVYAALRGMGIVHGPAMQVLRAVHRGRKQVLAKLSLPEVVERTQGEYVLHPSLMGGALQATVGLMEFARGNGNGSGSGNGNEGRMGKRLPYGLEEMRIRSGCGEQMWAWVRYARGSQRGDGVEKVDIDLCDAAGQVCVEMRGVSWQATGEEREAEKEAEREERATPAVVRVRREIALSNRPEEERESGGGTSKPRGILLAELESGGVGEAGVANREEGVRAEIRLKEPAVAGSVEMGVSVVRLLDCGEGVYRIEMAGRGTRRGGGEEAIGELVAALERVKEEKELKVVMIVGMEEWLGSGREEYNAA